MRIARTLIIMTVALVSFCASAQSSELNKLVNKYKDLPEALYTEKRNPETGDVLKKEVIVTIEGEKNVKELYSAVDKLAKDAKGVYDLTKTKDMVEVRIKDGDKSISVMVSGKRDGSKVSFIYTEKPYKKSGGVKVISSNDMSELHNSLQEIASIDWEGVATEITSSVTESVSIDSDQNN